MHKCIMVNIGGSKKRAFNENRGKIDHFAEIRGKFINFVEMKEEICELCGNIGEYAICVIGLGGWTVTQRFIAQFGKRVWK